MRLLCLSLVAVALAAAAAASAQTNAAPARNGRIVFERGPGGLQNLFGSPRTELWTMTGAGRRLVRLTKNGTYDGNPAWSPNGKKLAFESTRAGDFDIWVADASGKHAHELTFSAGYDGNPAWSPDGTRIAFQSDRLGTGTTLWVMNADGTSQHAIVSAAGATYTAPTWSPDGTRIAYAKHVVSCAPVCVGTDSIWTVAPDGSDPRQLFTAPGDTNDPVWSPDGTKIAFESNTGGDYDVYVMNADGSGVRDLTNHPALDASPAWSPDGRRIAFLSDRAKKSYREIYVMSAAGGRATRLTHSPAGFSSEQPDWQPLP
jgi:Tol biopolymer transport system component